MQHTATAPPPTDGIRTWEATYTGTADQVRRVRAWVRPLLGSCPVSDEVVMLISELCANAVLHSDSGKPGGRFTVRLRHLPGEWVRAEVQDQGKSTWDGDLARSARHPHGLCLLLTLSTRCGIKHDTRSRTAWFWIDCPSHLASSATALSPVPPRTAVSAPPC